MGKLEEYWNRAKFWSGKKLIESKLGVTLDITYDDIQDLLLLFKRQQVENQAIFEMLSGLYRKWLGEKAYTDVLFASKAKFEKDMETINKSGGAIATTLATIIEAMNKKARENKGGSPPPSDEKKPDWLEP